MDLHVVLMVGTALVSGGLVWLAATTATEPSARRGVLALAVALVALFYIATADLLGRAKPTSIEIFRQRLEHAEVLAHHLLQDEAIFVWVVSDVGGDPVSYRLPWVEQTARDLHEASSKAEEQGGTVQLTVPPNEQGAEGGEPSIDWAPPVAPPPKER